MMRKFGGIWTEKKLQALKKYLRAYMQIMKHNARACHLRTIYLDGFAGSGRRHAKPGAGEPGLFEEFAAPEVAAFFKGSPHVAMELQEPFDEYIFVEKDRDAAANLAALCKQFPHLSTRVEPTDANRFIPSWADTLKRNDRAVVFLDPYGMQVDWTTIKILAKTEKVNLWLLVPLGQAIRRLLTQRKPPKPWADALTRFLGTDEWQELFYREATVDTLFGPEDTEERNVDYERITKFIVARLQEVFVRALQTPVVLRNSKGVPLYLLCFAASNPKGAKTAIRIATDIAERLDDGG